MKIISSDLRVPNTIIVPAPMQLKKLRDDAGLHRTITQLTEGDDDPILERIPVKSLLLIEYLNHYQPG